jgi:hypothetical protein
MADIAPPIPTVGQPDSTEEPKIVTALNALVGAVNNVEADQLHAVLAAALGVSQAGTTRRGYAEVLTSQSTTSASYVDLATAGPSVTVNVPTNGLVLVVAQADITAPAGQADVALTGDALTPSGILDHTGTLLTLYTGPFGATSTRQQAQPYTFPASSGNRTFKLQYTVAVGTGTFANRKLWVWTLGP